VKGILFNIQRFSVHDGPGIRTTVFLKGCPLSCPWCHNPEGLSRELELLIVRDRCVGCARCVEVCSVSAATLDDRGPATDRLACLRCGRCVDVCVAGARRMVGETIEVDELIAKTERDRAFYEESGGGVTFSGGEPFDQCQFLLNCLRECRERGLHTAVDTSGHAPRGAVLEATELADLFLFDLKVMDEEEHKRLTGVSLAPVLANLDALDESGAEVWVRFPFIPGFTDSMRNVESLGRKVASLRTKRVHVLPFHHTASDKYARIAADWEHVGLVPATDEAVARAARVLEGMGLEVVVGG